jgi:hypothetical protein
MKTSTPSYPKPKSQPTTPQTRRRRTYAEAVTVNAGGEKGKGQDSGRSVTGERGRPAANDAPNQSSGNGAINMGYGSGNGGRLGKKRKDTQEDGNGHRTGDTGTLVLASMGTQDGGEALCQEPTKHR